MANEPMIYLVGNATGDAELRFLSSGVGVASFSVAVTPRVKDGDNWADGETTYYRCSAWRQMAEAVGETVTKGMRLVVHGRLKTRTWEKDGEKRLSLEVDVEEVGPSLRYATATVTKVARDGARQGAPASGGGDQWASARTSAPVDDSPPF